MFSQLLRLGQAFVKRLKGHSQNQGQIKITNGIHMSSDLSEGTHTFNLSSCEAEAEVWISLGYTVRLSGLFLKNNS